MVGVGRDLCGSSTPTPPTEAGSPRAGCTGPCPGGSWISPEKETPQPPWAACSSAPSPSEGRSCSSCSDRTSCASFCAHCPLSCCWALLKRVWPHPPDTHPSDICKYILGPLSCFCDDGLCFARSESLLPRGSINLGSSETTRGRGGCPMGHGQGLMLWAGLKWGPGP